MKILLMGDASSYHATLADALREMGHDVTVASTGNYWMDTQRDIDIGRGAGRLSGALLWLKLNTTLASRLKGYDVVSLAGCGFLDLKPNRITSYFNKLRSKNGAVFLTDLATTTPFVEMCCDTVRRQLPYSEWRSPEGEVTEYAKKFQSIYDAWMGVLSPMCRTIYDNVDGVVTALYEYHLAAGRWVEPERLAYAGIPIDVKRLGVAPLDFNSPQLNLFMGMPQARALEKGADRLEWIVNEVMRRDPEHFTFEKVVNLPLREYLAHKRRSHIVFDQLYSMTPGVNALQSMSCGQVVVSGGEDVYYDFINESKLRPIINPIPGREEECVEQLLDLAHNRKRLRTLGEEGKTFVRRHNDSKVVAQRFLDFWTSILSKR